MSESNVQINFSGDVPFPQPMAEAPKRGVEYFYIDDDGKVESSEWDCDRIDIGRLDCGNVYMTRDEAEQRRAWNAQQMRRLVIPAWFRALGPDVEHLYVGGGWQKISATFTPQDWTKEDPKRYRSKPRNVVVTVNGKEYRWPQTVKAGEPRGKRYILNNFDIITWDDHTAYGNFVHHTRAGAESQLAAIRAAAGVAGQAP